MYTIEELFLPEYCVSIHGWFCDVGKHLRLDDAARTPKNMLSELGVAVYSMAAYYNEKTGEYELPMKTELALYGMDQPCTP